MITIVAIAAAISIFVLLLIIAYLCGMIKAARSHQLQRQVKEDITIRRY